MTSLAHVAALRLRRSPRRRARTLVLGVPLTMQPSWVFGVVLTAWTATDALLPALVPERTLLTYTIGGVALAAGLAVSLALHEAAHCLAARRGGLAVRRLSLGFLGGEAELDTMPRTPRVQAAVALAGPVTNALVVVVAAVMHIALVEIEADPLLAAITAVLALANLALTVLNLAPGLPLDGGRVLHAVVWALIGRQATATRIAAAAGRALGAALLVIALVVAATGDTAVALWLAILGLGVNGG
jgi:Zn-dependent protease